MEEKLRIVQLPRLTPELNFPTENLAQSGVWSIKSGPWGYEDKENAKKLKQLLTPVEDAAGVRLRPRSQMRLRQLERIRKKWTKVTNSRQC